MMSDKHEELLERCSNGVDIYSLDGHDQDVLRDLYRMGYVEPEGGRLSSTVYVLTPGGEAYLSSKKKYAEEMAKKAAEKKAEKHNEHVFEVKLSLLSAAVGSALTLIVEHFDWIISLFHR